MSRLVRRIAGGILLLTAWAGIAVAESYVAHTDLELRVGADFLCGTCGQEPGEHANRARTMVQVFADRLFPVGRLGDGVFEIGLYAKGALLDGGHVPQVAGGVAAGYRVGVYEVLVHAGRAYATERIGMTANTEDDSQTKHTYDLGISLRCDIRQYFVSIGYGHNSNGDSLGLNFSGGKGNNPGIDSAFVGVGIRF